MKVDVERLKKLAALIRYYILISTTAAGSGHPTSSLSAADLMTALLFGGGFKADLDDFENPVNDRLIFSKGHASPLLYALYAAAGKLTEIELTALRKFSSNLEGHPTTSFPYAEVATGSLGQGLPVGVGMALNAKYVEKTPCKIFVLLGDSEMSEGSQWEAIQVAAKYGLNNLIGIIDVNRLGQSTETMYGHNLDAYHRRINAFGWLTVEVDGHNFDAILSAYQMAASSPERPVMIIAKTIKGKGVSFIENLNGWHGKSLNKDELERAIAELGKVDTQIRGEIEKPARDRPAAFMPASIAKPEYKLGEPVATRKAYGSAITRIYPGYPDMVVLDAEVSNSTYSGKFRDKYPERYFEMYIAEQNMAGAALGFSRRGRIPFVSTFAAFLTRAFDQIRMSQYSGKLSNIKFAGSHCGVSIGEDGPSQMGLEDIAMFRTVMGMTVLYPSDAVSTEKLVEKAAAFKGNVYIRLTRMETPVIYENDEVFEFGGSKTLRASDTDKATVVAAGATLHQALKAYDELKKDGINIRVIDLYSIAPIDAAILKKAANETQALITVEDHFPAGGLGEAVKSALEREEAVIRSLAVSRVPKSGRPDELLDYEGISAATIIKTAKEI